MNKTAFQNLFDRCAFQIYERQNRLSNLVGDRDWLLDTEAAILTFGDDLVFPVQFLGTFSDLSKTWLWADANSKVALPSHSLELCRKVRASGQAAGIDECAVDQFPFSDEVGKPSAGTLVMMAVSLSEASAYYKAPHDAGDVYLLINDKRIDEQPDLNKESFLEAFNNLMWYPGDTKQQIVSYLAEKGCIDKTWDGTKLECSLSNGDLIRMRFRRSPSGGMSIRFNS